MPLNFILKNKYFIFSIPFFIYFISFFNLWHPQDDHEIALFSDFIKNHSILESLKLTEVFKWGEFKRLRPSYYTLRIIESYLWGSKLYLWQLVRMIIQLLFLAEVLLWIKNKFNDKEIFFILLIMVSMIFWRDLQSRLGPGETYCILGLILISFSVRNEAYKWLYFIGSLIAIGSKENFLITPLITFFLLFQLKRLSFIDLIFHLILLAYSLFIGIGILNAIGNSGGDIYMNEVTLASRMLGLVKGFFTIQMIPHLLLVIGIIKKRFELSKIEKTLWIISLFVLTFNILFYSGTIPGGNRYDFPAVPINIISWLILYEKIKSLYSIKYLPLIIFLFSLSGIYRQASTAWKRHQESKAFTHSIKKLAKNLIGKKNILLLTNTTSNFEIVLFIPRLLKIEGINSNFYFLPKIVKVPNNYHFSLKKEMEWYSQHGLNHEIKQLPAPKDCIQVNFGEKITDKECSEIVNF